jgi:hypothetical protein
MELIVAIITIIGGAIAIYTFLFGQKGLVERLQEKKKKKFVDELPNNDFKIIKDETHNLETNKMLALSKEYSKPGFVLTTKPIPSVQPHEVLVKVQAISICGSDLHIYHWSESIIDVHQS